MSLAGIRLPGIPSPSSASRRALIAIILTSIIGAGFWFWIHNAEKKVIRLGILHSLTGPMAISEKPMMEAELLAVDEINASGGLLGHTLEAIVEDGASNPEVFEQKAKALLLEHKVSVIIGCWTSASRKSIKPVIERHNALLVYPMAYEGLEASPNIIYTGATPNQQVLPAVNWSYQNIGKRFLLIGSDYIWPHAVNAIARDQIMALGGEVIDELYLPFGGMDPSEAVRRIRETRPDVILSTVVGDSNAPFYRQLREAGITAKQSPVISFSIGESEAHELTLSDIAGHYSAWAYFESVDRAENRTFTQKFRARYGTDRFISAVSETAYLSTHLWARGVKQAGSSDPGDVQVAMLGLSLNAPEGIVTIDPASRHTWQNFNLGQIRDDGGIEIVWSTDHGIRPRPYPNFRSVKEWDTFVENLYIGWNRSWVNLATRP